MEIDHVDVERLNMTGELDSVHEVYVDTFVLLSQNVEEVVLNVRRQ